MKPSVNLRIFQSSLFAADLRSAVNARTQVMRLAGVTLVLALVAMALIPTPAYSLTETQLKAQLERLKQETASAGKSFDDAKDRVEAVEEKIKKNRSAVARTQKQLKIARKKLNRLAESSYRGQGMYLLIDMLLSANDFESFIKVYEYSARIGDSYSDTIDKTTALSQRLKRQQRQLAVERDARAKELKPYREKLDRLNQNLKKIEAQYKSVQSQLAKVRSRRNAALGITSVSVSAGANGMVFPVSGSYYYSDTWGAARSGGRTHQGTDVMARRGTPLVAFTSGSIRVSYNGLGGKCVYITGDNGWTAYYAHMDSISRTSGRVKAGEVVGTVGDSGNARGTPHLHIQLWKNGALLNPYPILKAME